MEPGLKIKGYLYKQKRIGKTYFISPIVKRYFVLDFDKGIFSYGNSRKSTQRESFRFSEFIDYLAYPPIRLRPSKAPFPFQVEFRDREFTLFAETG